MEEHLKCVIDSINKFNEEAKKEIYEKFGLVKDKNSYEINIVSKEGKIFKSLEEIIKEFNNEEFNNEEFNKIMEKYNYLNTLFTPIINYKD